MNRRLLCLLPVIALLVAPLSARAGPTATITLARRPIVKRILDNGLIVLIREDHSAPVVSAQTWVRAGSTTEAEWLGAGLSHVLEHMLFKGTTTRDVGTIAREIEDQGGDFNAFTSFDETVYHIDLPSENWQTAVDILADCMMNATIPEEELAREKKVILREMAMNRDDPDRRAGRLLWATAFTTHPYRLPVIGYPDIYDRTTRADVYAYYKKHYLPNNMVFVVVGDIDAGRVLDRIKTLTADFKMGPIPLAPRPAEPPQLGLRRRDEEMPVQLSQVNLAWHIPALTHPDVYALDLLAIVLGQGETSRLYHELREKRGLVHAVSASSYTPRDPGLFSVDAATDPDQREPAIQAIRAEINRLSDRGVTPAELQKSLKLSASHLLAQLKTVSGQASDLGSSELLLGDPDWSVTYLERLRQVTADDVRRVARTWLTDGNLTITTLNPPGTLPATPPTAAAATNAPIQLFTLPNGLRLLVREDPKLPFVTFRALLAGGVFSETAADNGISRLTARMLLKGTAARNADQIVGPIEAAGGSLDYQTGNSTFGIVAQVLDTDFTLGLDTVADVLLHPSFPADALAREKTAQLAEIKEDQDQVFKVAQQLLRDALYQRHPYRLNQFGMPASVARLTRDQLAAYHRRLVVPSNIVFCVFGKVDAATVRREVTRALGGLRGPPPEFASGGPERLAQPQRREQTVPREQAVLLVGFSGADVRSGDRFALELLNNACSGMGSDLFRRVRDQLGLAYYVGAYQLLGLEPGYLAFYVGTTPDKLATCEQEILAEVRTLQTQGLKPAELERAKNSIIGQQRLRVQDNNEFSLVVALDELYGLGYDYHRALESRYRRVTNDDIKRVAARYLGDAPHAVVVVKPK